MYTYYPRLMVEYVQQHQVKTWHHVMLLISSSSSISCMYLLFITWFFFFYVFFLRLILMCMVEHVIIQTVVQWRFKLSVWRLIFSVGSSTRQESRQSSVVSWGWKLGCLRWLCVCVVETYFTPQIYQEVVDSSQCPGLPLIISPLPSLLA